ncbi:MAG: hypothetical protein QOH05_3069 [Acetobacteraceae bacterium]|jgi:hypothetical protein|nr:hypothetical protein [Acetobacteraceae bacterium]
MMRRRYWVTFVTILLLLVAGEATYWRVAAERLRTGYQAWLAARVAQGWEVGSGPLSIGGWPRAATVTVPNLTLRHAGPTIPGDVNVASAGVTLAVSLFNPNNLHLSLTGPTHVRAADLPDMIVTGDETSASVPLRQDGPLFVALHASGLRLEPATGAWHTTVGLLNAQVEFAADPPADQSQPAAVFSLSSEAIALPAGIKAPLGANVSSLSMDGRLNGPLPNTRDITRWAEAWRDGGGSLEITHLAMGWGPLGLTSSATLALDDQLQPMGSGSGRIVGYAETLDRLAAGGMLTKSAATAAKAVLSLMAGTSDADEPSAVDVPLTLQYRTLSMRQVPLVRLPEVDWPAR